MIRSFFKTMKISTASSKIAFATRKGYPHERFSCKSLGICVRPGHGHQKGFPPDRKDDRGEGRTRVRVSGAYLEGAVSRC